MQVDEITAWATLMTNLRRKTHSRNPMMTAQSAKELAEKYGQKEVAKRIGVSDSTIQMWAKIASLPEQFKQYVSERKIYPWAAYRIACSFPKHDEQLEMAREVLGWGEPEILAVIKVKRANPGLSIKECKNLVIKEGIRVLQGAVSRTDSTQPGTP